MYNEYDVDLDSGTITRPQSTKSLCGAGKLCTGEVFQTVLFGHIVWVRAVGRRAEGGGGGAGGAVYMNESHGV